MSAESPTGQVDTKIVSHLDKLGASDLKFIEKFKFTGFALPYEALAKWGRQILAL